MVFLFVNRIKQDASSEALGRVIPEHARWIEQRLAAGQVVQAGKWGDIGGMVIYRADSRQEADALAREDPLVASGLISYELERFWPMREL